MLGDPELVSIKGADTAVSARRLLAVSAGFVLNELTLLRLRGLLARAHGDAYRQFMADFRAKAAAAGFEPLVAVVDG